MKLAPLIWNVFNFSQKEKLFNSGRNIILSVSGGLDSTFMLHAFHAIQKQFSLNLHIAHFHHGLREQSNTEESFVLELGKSLNIPVTVFKTQTLTSKKGMQGTARNWRKEKLVELKDSLGFNLIAQAHHLDDLAETQIWRILRGCSLYQLQPMKPIENFWIKPLLNIRKSEIKSFMQAEKLDWMEDESNFENVYTRNRIRNEILPALKEISGHHLEEKLLELAKESASLNHLFHESISPSVYQKKELNKQDVQQTPEILAKELIHQFLIYNGLKEINRKQIEDIYKLCFSDKGKWQLNLYNNIRLFEEKGMIRLIH